MTEGANIVGPALTLELRVNELSLDTVVGEHRIYVPDGENYAGYWETRPATVLDLVIDRLVAETLRDGAVRGAIQRIRDELIREMVRSTVEEVMQEPFQPTNAYGEKIGEPQTLRGVIVDQAAKALTVKGTYNGSRETIAEVVIRETVDAAFRKELKAAVETEKARVLELMRAEGARVIGSMLAAAVK